MNTDSYVPDVINGVSFASVCEAHDKCYGILGSDKAFCDSQLGNNIVQACNKQLQGIPHAEEVLSSCHMAAGIYIRWQSENWVVMHTIMHRRRRKQR